MTVKLLRNLNIYKRKRLNCWKLRKKGENWINNLEKDLKHAQDLIQMKYKNAKESLEAFEKEKAKSSQV